MDVQMPHMDGLEATKLIRQTPLNLGTPIIAVTAHAFKEEQDRLLASGMDDYLPKPIDLSDLIDLISRWCEKVEETAESDPDFSWEIALKRTNHNETAARELLTEFIRQLPRIAADITDKFEAGQFEEVQNLVHQLHGACCYTGAPRLLKLCEEIESALKRKQTDLLITWIPQFSQAVTRFLANQDKKRYSDDP
jgi:two-component system, NarL family, sensor histidine kinase BarA